MGRWAIPHHCTSVLHGAAEPRLYTTPRRPGQVRYAEWEPHRLCGVEAKGEGGFTIPPIFRMSSRLRLNYRCEPGGYIQVSWTHRLLAALPFLCKGGPRANRLACCRRTLQESPPRPRTPWTR